MKRPLKSALSIGALSTAGLLFGLQPASADQPRRSELPGYASSQFQEDDTGTVELAQQDVTTQGCTLDVDMTTLEDLPPELSWE